MFSRHFHRKVRVWIFLSPTILKLLPPTMFATCFSCQLHTTVRARNFLSPTGWKLLSTYTIRVMFFLPPPYKGSCQDFPSPPWLKVFTPHKRFLCVFPVANRVTFFILKLSRHITPSTNIQILLDYFFFSLPCKNCGMFFLSLPCKAACQDLL